MGIGGAIDNFIFNLLNEGKAVNYSKKKIFSTFLSSHYSFPKKYGYIILTF